MKILHVVPSYYPAVRYGGPIKSVHELNKALVKQGIEVTVYTTNIDGKGVLNVPVGREVLIDGVKVYYFPVTWWFWQYSTEMKKALDLNTKNFDLIHITSIFLSASTLGARFARKYKKPYVISPRGSLMKETFHKGFLKKYLYYLLIEKRNLAGASVIHFTAEIEKDEYVAQNFPLQKSIIVPNGLDFKDLEDDVTPDYFRDKFGIPKNKKIILFLSRLSWKKGIDTLLPAFREVLKETTDYILVLSGVDDEGYGKTAEKLVKDLDIQENVIFTGMPDKKDTISAYKSAEIFVLPSYSENFALVVAEAMYFGVPVVVTENVGVASIVKEAEAGLVIKKNTEELRDALLSLVKNSELARQMGERGREACFKYLDWNKIAEKFKQEYNGLIS